MHDGWVDLRSDTVTRPTAGRVPALIEELRSRGVLAGPKGPGRVRFVTHLDVDDAGIDRAVAALRALSAARV
jgi:threonine aldolase